MDGKTNVKHVEIYHDAASQFRWRAVGGNGEIVAEGEAHTRESDAARAAQGVFGAEVVLIREGAVAPTAATEGAEA
jgi:uncharacterized protein YegP (UPF0339 family)